MEECAANQVESALDGIWEMATSLGLNLSQHTHEHIGVLRFVYLRDF